METTSVRLPARLVASLEAAASRRGVKRSTIVRKALEEHLGRARVRKSGMAALIATLVNYEGSGVGDLASRSEHYLHEMFRDRRRRSR